MYSGMVYVSWESVYKLIPFFSGHWFKFVSFLSPGNADGAVKFLLFRQDSGHL